MDDESLFEFVVQKLNLELKIRSRNWCVPKQWYNHIISVASSLGRGICKYNVARHKLRCSCGNSVRDIAVSALQAVSWLIQETFTII